MYLPLKKIVNYCFVVMLLLLSGKSVFAQITVVKGTIKDTKTAEPIAFATVFFDESSVGTTSDANGNYLLETNELSYTKLKVLAMGYVPLSKEVIAGTTQMINFKLTVDAKQLNEVVVKGQKSKYRNKDNPAVELIRKVIEHKSQNRKEGFDYYEYEKYEKLQFALSNVTDKFKSRKAFKKFQFVFENLDTTKLQGKPVLPVYMSESLSEVYYRKSPSEKKEIVKGKKTVAFEGYLNDQGTETYTKYLYQDINIYDNNITMLTNQFISPIANLSPTFYKFFIADTIVEKATKYIKLDFVPRNHADFLFQGSMYIAMDSSYAVSKIDMTVNKDINLNWVKELKIVQEFEKNPDYGYTLVNDEFSADFGLDKGKMGLYGQRIVSYKKYLVNHPRPDKDYKGDALEIMDNATTQADSFWVDNRHTELSTSEKGVYTTIDSIKKVPAFKRSMDIFILVFAGYKTIWRYFDLGPVSTFYSFNPVEGFRLRVGGKTTNAFSKKVVLEGYGAYGFKDKKWKYYGGVTYSLTKRSIYDFPVKYLKASYQRETKIPGQELQFIQEDNFLLSFKRGNNDKWLYNDILNLEYLNEFNNHFSFSIGYKNWIQQAAGGLHYNGVDYNDAVNDIKNLQTSEVSVVLRWAPNEKFYQGKTYRIPISFKEPIFTLRYINGIKGLLGGEYNYQNISLNITKRFYLSQLGFTDVAVEGGKVFGKVPFPLLSVHRANQTYSYQLQSYNLMNFLEFVSDQYASIQLDHNFNGFFFNKIPVIKRLKWREAMSLKVLYGSISDQNNPAKSDGLYQFPLTPEGIPITYSLGAKPYIEGSIGIANIFKFFRVDLVKRFTYLDHPDVSQLGIRARFKFDF